LIPRSQPLVGGGNAIVALAWGAFALLQIMRYSGSRRVVVAAIAVGLLLMFFGIVYVARARARVTLADGCLRQRTLVREQVVWTVGEPGQVVLVEVRTGSASHPTWEGWLLVDAKGRTAMCLNRKMWLPEELEALRMDLGLPVETVEDRFSKRAFVREFPGAWPWWLEKVPF